MTISFTGGCRCGFVRYECSAAPLLTVNCHCRDCQQATGGAYVSVVVVPQHALKITGEVKYYYSLNDNGDPVSRGFCMNCGSHLLGRPAVPEILTIYAGTLDDPSWYKPTMDIFTNSAQPWDHMNPELPKFSKNPPMA